MLTLKDTCSIIFLHCILLTKPVQTASVVTAFSEDFGYSSRRDYTVVIVISYQCNFISVCFDDME